jgi:hypothetical protein
MAPGDGHGVSFIAFGREGDYMPCAGAQLERGARP